MAAILNFKMATNVHMYKNTKVDYFIQLVVTNNMPKGISSTLLRMMFTPSHHANMSKTSLQTKMLNVIVINKKNENTETVAIFLIISKHLDLLIVWH